MLAGCSSWMIIGGGAAGVGSVGDVILIHQAVIAGELLVFEREGIHREEAVRKEKAEKRRMW